MQTSIFRTLRLVVSALCVSMLTACSSVGYKAISFEVLRPANYTLPAWTDTVIVADGVLCPVATDSTVPANMMDSITAGRAEKLCQQVCQAMMTSINNSKFLKAKMWFPQNGKRGLSTSDINTMLKGTSHTIILSLSELSSSANIKAYAADEGEGTMMCGMITASTATRMEIVTSPTSRYPLDMRNDTIIFTACDYTPTLVAEKLPSVSRRYINQGVYVGEKNADAFIPVWQTVYRSIYVSSESDMLAAASWIEKDSWNEAINLWNRVATDAKHTADKVRAMLNLALAYERADDPTLAAIWCSRALDTIDAMGSKAKKLDDEKERATSMFAYLMERQQQKNALDAQMQ